MKTRLHIATLLITIAALFFLSANIGGAERKSEATQNSLWAAHAQDEEEEATSGKPLSCLPKGVRAEDVVTYGGNGKPNVTVQKTLVELKARCRKGKLVDAKRKEIRFFHPSCWGNPPPDYREIQQQESEDLANLKKHYTVIVFSCNRMIS